MIIIGLSLSQSGTHARGDTVRRVPATAVRPAAAAGREFRRASQTPAGGTRLDIQRRLFDVLNAATSASARP